jgi:hypothetical protein
VLGCLLACCLRACLCVVRRYASLQALACCLLCAVVTTAPSTSARPPPCGHAAPRAPPDLIFRRRRQQRGRLSSAQPGWQPLPQEMPRRESRCLVIPSCYTTAITAALAFLLSRCPPCYCPMLLLFAVIFFHRLVISYLSCPHTSSLARPRSNHACVHRRSAIAPCRSTSAVPTPSTTSPSCRLRKRASSL